MQGPSETGINIAIADDYPVLIAGMRQSLASCDDIVVVAECTRISDLVAQVALKKPDIILLWVRDRSRQPGATIAQHCRTASRCEGYCLHRECEPESPRSSTANGAKGVLLKHWRRS